MERTLKEIEADILFEEALLENEWRNEYARQYAKWEEEYLTKTRWYRFWYYNVWLSIHIRLIDIRNWIRVFVQ